MMDRDALVHHLLHHAVDETLRVELRLIGADYGFVCAPRKVESLDAGVDPACDEQLALARDGLFCVFVVRIGDGRA